MFQTERTNYFLVFGTTRMKCTLTSICRCISAREGAQQGGCFRKYDRNTSVHMKMAICPLIKEHESNTKRTQREQETKCMLTPAQSVSSFNC